MPTFFEKIREIENRVYAIRDDENCEACDSVIFELNRLMGGVLEHHTDHLEMTQLPLVIQAAFVMMEEILNNLEGTRDDG